MLKHGRSQETPFIHGSQVSDPISDLCCPMKMVLPKLWKVL